MIRVTEEVNVILVWFTSFYHNMILEHFLSHQKDAALEYAILEAPDFVQHVYAEAAADDQYAQPAEAP